MKTSEKECLGYIEEQWLNILKLYKRFEDKKPVKGITSISAYTHAK